MSDPVIDCIMNRLNCSSEAADYWADYIAKMTFGTPSTLYDSKGDIENLESMERALKSFLKATDFDAMTGAAHDTLLLCILWGPYRDTAVSGYITKHSPIQEYTNNLGRPASSAITELEENSKTILAAIAKTKSIINQSPLARKAFKRINVQGVLLVDAVRKVWSFVGRNPPARALNPASEFGVFLTELFEAFKVEGDAKAAFRAWVNHSGK